MKPLRFNAVQVCWLIIGFWSTLVQAQPLAKNPAYTISVNFWGRDKGLPGLAALSIGQDPQGFIWVSTQETVSRFDGQRFTPLSLSAATGGSTSGNGGHSAYLQDRQGNRWLVGNGIAGYQQQLIMKPGQVIPRPINEAFGRAAGPRQEVIINYIPSAGHRFQYIRTQEGQIRRHLGQGRFKTLFSHPGLRESYCLTSFETNRQTLLLSFPDSRSSTSGQLLELDTTGRILQQHRFPHWLRPIRENADGSIYLYRVLDYAPTYLRQPATFDAFLYQLSRDGKLSTIPFNLGRNPLPTPTVSDLGLVNLQYDAHHDLFWLTGPHLLIAWHPEKGVVFDITKEHAALVASSIITSVYVDKTGAVWA